MTLSVQPAIALFDTARGEACGVAPVGVADPTFFAPVTKAQRDAGGVRGVAVNDAGLLVDADGTVGGVPVGAVTDELTGRMVFSFAPGYAVSTDQYVNVCDFPANGVSGQRCDPTGAIRSDQGIQAAIDYAASAKVPVMIYGKFRVEAPLYLKTGTRIVGAGSLTSELVAYHAGNIIEMFDDDSIFCSIENIKLNGNRQALSGLFFKRITTQYGVPGKPILYDITHTNVKNVTITRCTSNGITVGVDGTGSVMELAFDGIFAEDNAGYGVYLSSRTTDGIFNNIVARENKGGGVYFGGSNCRLSNLKTYYSGSAATPKPGYYITGARSAFVNIEAQDNFGHGFEIVSATNHELTNLVADCNGNYDGGITPPVTPAYDGVFLQNCVNLSIKMTALDWRYSAIGGYTQRSGINIDGNNNDKINIIGNFASTSRQDLICTGSSKNINLTKVGAAEKTVVMLPATTTISGITYTKFSDAVLGIKGTASADSTLQMYGAFGDATNYKIPIKAGQKIKVNISDTVIGATLYVVINGSTILAATTSNRMFVVDADGFINNIFIKVLSGVNVGEICVNPKITIFN